MDPRQHNGRPNPTGVSGRKARTGSGSFQRVLSSNPSPPPAPAPAPAPAGPIGLPTTVCGKCGFAVPYMRQFEGKPSSCPKCRAPIVLGRAAAPKAAPQPPRPAPAAAPHAQAPQAPAPAAAAPQRQAKPPSAKLRPGSATQRTAKPASSTQKSAGLFARRPSQRAPAQDAGFKILSSNSPPAEDSTEVDEPQAPPVNPARTVPPPAPKKPPSTRQPEARDLVVPPDVLKKAEAESEAAPPQKAASKRQPAETEAKAEAEPPPQKAAPKELPPKAENDDADNEDDEELDGDAAAAPVRVGAGGGKRTKLAIAAVVLLSLLAGGAALAWKKKHASGGGGTAAGRNPDDSGDEGAPGSVALQVHATIGSATFQKPRPRSTTNLLLSSAGAVAACQNNPQFLNDGNSTEFDGGNGYAGQPFSNPPAPTDGQMTVTLKEPRELTRLRFLLWDKDDRTYGYILSVSPDGKNWKKIKDNSKGGCRSWQEFKFERQNVKVVSLKGTANTSNNELHVVELEGYDDGAELEKLTPRKPPSGPIKSAAANMKPGIWAEFFDGCDNYPAVEDKPDLTLARNWLSFGAAPGVGLHDWPFAGPCGAIFSGYFKIEKPGLYTFFVQSQDGARLYIDGELLIANESHKLQEVWEQTDLSAGLHRIYIEYFVRSTWLGLNVSLKQKGESKEFLTDKVLLFDPADIGSADSDGRHTPDVLSEEAKSSARFLSRNDKRGGAWKNDVGHDGYVIFNKTGGGQHLVKLPPYIAAVNSSGSHCVWQVGADPRGLEEPTGGGQRLCTCEYDGSDVAIDIRASRGTTNRLSIYLLDFDKSNRHEKVQIMDRDNTLVDNDPGDMTAGTWMQYEISGPVTVHIVNNGGPNSVVAGIFWDSDKGVHFRAPQKGPPSGELKAGVIAEYFEGLITYPTEDDAPLFFRLEPAISFGGTPAASGERVMHGWPLTGACAALFYGAIKIPQDDKYVFDLESDDGARLYIDGEKVADNDGCHPMKEVEAAVDLKAGAHRIWVEYFNAGGQMGLNLWMKQKDGKKIPVPKEMLFHE